MTVLQRDPSTSNRRAATSGPIRGCGDRRGGSQRRRWSRSTTCTCRSAAAVEHRPGAARRVPRDRPRRDPRHRRRVRFGQERARSLDARAAARRSRRRPSRARRRSTASTWSRRAADARRLVRRRHLGAVFQDPMTSLNPTMRVGRQIAEVAGSIGRGPAAARRGRRPRAEAPAAGLPPRAVRRPAPAGDDRPGHRRRAVARRSPTSPPPPSTSPCRRRSSSCSRHLRDETGCSFVLVTHDLGVAAQIADRVAVLYGGRLAEVGTAADVLERPAHPYTHGPARVAARRSRPAATARCSRCPVSRPIRGTRPSGCPFAPRCDRMTEAMHAPNRRS